MEFVVAVADWLHVHTYMCPLFEVGFSAVTIMKSITVFMNACFIKYLGAQISVVAYIFRYFFLFVQLIPLVCLVYWGGTHTPTCHHVNLRELVLPFHVGRIWRVMDLRSPGLEGSTITHRVILLTPVLLSSLWVAFLIFFFYCFWFKVDFTWYLI